MIVIARSPLETHHDVTTMVVAGYTALATRVTARELVLGEPPVEEEAMTDRCNHLLAYTFRYRKPKRSPDNTSGDLRKEIADSGRWAPPWDAVVDD